jgi:D-beta-D-heptose 7-phosphate kinase/D-beta-D-heptose 1-phosphate adenosyltransferase
MANKGIDFASSGGLSYQFHRNINDKGNMKISPKRADQIIRAFAGKKVLVLGDLMLDEYLFGLVSRISPEAPVPVVEVDSEKLLLGGAANVAWNIRSLGGRAVPVGVTGRDRARNILAKELSARGIPTSGLVEEKGRHTTVKTRIVAHRQQVVRVDREHSREISAASAGKLISALKRLLPGCDALLIEDYNKGLVTGRLLKDALELARHYKKIVTVDPKFNHFLDFKGVTLFKPNVHETERALGLKLKNARDLARAGKILLEKLEAGAVLITAGERGMFLCLPGRTIKHIPTAAREVYDVSGAGDTVIAAITLALASGAGFEEAAVLANHAAGVEISKFGVAAVTPVELRKALGSW